MWEGSRLYSGFLHFVLKGWEEDQTCSPWHCDLQMGKADLVHFTRWGQISEGLLLHHISWGMSKEPGEGKNQRSMVWGSIYTGLSEARAFFMYEKGFLKWVFLVTVLISSNQISILWFIYCEFDEPFSQHCPMQCCAVHCHWWAVPSSLSEHSCEHWRVAGAPLASPCTLTTPWCWVLLALCACQLKWHLVPYGNSPCSWNMGCVFGLDELPPQ